MLQDNLSIQRTVIRLTSGLEQAGFHYAIGGAIALGFWAVPRATLDIDIGVHVVPGTEPSLLTVLRNIGCEFKFQDALEAALRGDFGVQLEGVRVDVYLPVFELAEEALNTAVEVTFFGRKISIVTPEILFLLKLVYGRTKDYADLENLVASQRENLDLSYLERWVVDLFDPDDERRVKFNELTKACGQTEVPSA